MVCILIFHCVTVQAENIFERERISLVKVYKRLGKSVIWVCKEGLTDAFYGCEKKNGENFWLCDLLQCIYSSLKGCKG